jgi:hypothetical protein
VGDASPPARARATSTSSCVRFLDWRKAIRFSMGDADTLGSCRTVDSQYRQMLGIFGSCLLTCHLKRVSNHRMSCFVRNLLQMRPNLPGLPYLYLCSWSYHQTWEMLMYLSEKQSHFAAVNLPDASRAGEISVAGRGSPSRESQATNR